MVERLPEWAGVPGREQIERFAAAAVARIMRSGRRRSVAHSRSNGQGRYAWLFATGLKANQIGLN